MQIDRCEMKTLHLVGSESRGVRRPLLRPGAPQGRDEVEREKCGKH
jgi:hypothetical protein